MNTVTTLGDITADQIGQVMRFEGMPPRVIDSVRHYRVDDGSGTAARFTSVIHRDPAAKPGDAANELRALATSPVEVRGA